MPTLNWLGKDKVVNYAAKVSFHVLDKKYNFGGESQNKIIHGDNLLALKSLLPLYEGKIKCIYIDPPYNTGNENWVYNDNVNSPQIQKWLGQVVGREGEDYTRHDKWLCMMYPRLKLLKKLLSNDGAIFISIDDNEQANLKLICDEIFGEQNFLAKFCVKRSGGRQDSKFFAITSEFMFSYAKNINNFTAGKDIKENDKFPKFDESTGRNYKTQLLRKWGANSRRIDRPNLFYAIPAPDGTELFPMLSKTEEGCWRWGKNKMQAALENNLIEFVKKNDEWIAYEKIFQPLDGVGTKKFTTWIDENFSGTDLVKNIFDYPKSVGLIEKVLKMCNVDKNSIVLDSFAGSGTTAHAVIKLNAEDGGNRKFILVEMENYAENITAERVKRVGGNFNFYEVGAPIFIDDELNENLDVEKIREYIWQVDTRTEYVKLEVEDCAEFMGVDKNVAYYFYEGTLDFDFLRTMRTRADSYIIYAEACAVDEEFMRKYQIEFRKIPRDILRYEPTEIF